MKHLDYFKCKYWQITIKKEIQQHLCSIQQRLKTPSRTLLVNLYVNTKLIEMVDKDMT